MFQFDVLVQREYGGEWTEYGDVDADGSFVFEVAKTLLSILHSKPELLPECRRLERCAKTTVVGIVLTPITLLTARWMGKSRLYAVLPLGIGALAFWRCSVMTGSTFVNHASELELEENQWFFSSDAQERFGQLYNSLGLEGAVHGVKLSLETSQGTFEMRIPAWARGQQVSD